MSNKFDELAKGLAQSVTRRQAFKKFGVGVAGMALACFGLANTARAGKGNGNLKGCSTNSDCNKNQICYGGICYTTCKHNGDCHDNRCGCT